MKKVRTSTFETNSSSTHALVVPHSVSDDSYDVYDSLDHNYSFGREESRLVEHYDEKLAYIYYIVKDLAERTLYSKTNPTDRWGNDYGITDDVVNRFKNTVNEVYEEVLTYLDRKPYDNDPTPDDIFYLIDHKDNLRSIDSSRDIVWSINRYVELDFIGKDELDRELTDEEYSLTDRYSDCDDIVVTVKELTDDEKELARLSHILPDYVRNYYSDVYVDHTEDFGSNGFVDVIKKCDKEYIKRMIFSRDSYITVGGDEYRGYNIKTIGFEYDYNDHEEYYENEAGERCPSREEFGDDDDSFNRYWEERSKYNIVRDNGGFNDRLREYEKENDVFLKGN